MSCAGSAPQRIGALTSLRIWFCCVVRGCTLPRLLGLRAEAGLLSTWLRVLAHILRACCRLCVVCCGPQCGCVPRARAHKRHHWQREGGHRIQHASTHTLCGGVAWTHGRSIKYVRLPTLWPCPRPPAGHSSPPAAHRPHQPPPPALLRLVGAFVACCATSGPQSTPLSLSPRIGCCSRCQRKCCLAGGLLGGAGAGGARASLTEREWWLPQWPDVSFSPQLCPLLHAWLTT